MLLACFNYSKLSTLIAYIIFIYIYLYLSIFIYIYLYLSLFIIIYLRIFIFICESNLVSRNIGKFLPLEYLPILAARLDYQRLQAISDPNLQFLTIKTPYVFNCFHVSWFHQFHPTFLMRNPFNMFCRLNHHVQVPKFLWLATHLSQFGA
jgi:hypothetical protein